MNQQTAYQFFVQRGWQPHHAAGIIGNLMQESGLRTDAVGDGGNSFGIAQWNGPRRKAMVQFARQKGADPRDLQTQLEFVDWELRNTEKAAGAALSQAQDVATATRVFSEKYERPGDPRMENRLRFAGQFAGGPLEMALSGAGAGAGGQEAPAALSMAPPAALARSGMALDPALKPVTDPDLLRQLEGDGLKPVTNPALLRELEGAQETPDGPQGPPLAAPPQMDVLQRYPMVDAAVSYFGGPQARADVNQAAVGMANSAMANFGDEAVGAIDGPRAAMRMRTDQADLARRNPALATTGEIAGALGTAAAAGAGLVGRTSSTLGKVAAGALEGGIFGGLYAAGGADKGQKVAEGVQGAAGGAVAGGVATRALVGLERYLGLRAARRAAPAADDLKAASQQLYEAAAQSGVVYRPQAVQQAVDDIGAEMASNLIDPTLHPKASAVIKRLPELVSKPATLREVERYRQLAGQAARDAQAGSADERLASMVVDALDEFTMDQGNMVATSGGAELQREARRLWSQHMKDQRVSFAVEKAARRAASTGSGGNIEKAIRQNITAIRNNPKLMRGFTRDEIAAMDRIIEGGRFDNFMSLIGKLSPSGNGLMLALQTAGLVSTSGASVPLIALGAGAKKLADTATTRRVASLGAMIRSGAKPPFGQIAQLSPPERQALARLVSAQGGEALGAPMVEGFRSMAGSGRTQ